MDDSMIKLYEKWSGIIADCDINVTIANSIKERLRRELESDVKLAINILPKQRLVTLLSQLTTPKVTPAYNDTTK